MKNKSYLVCGLSLCVCMNILLAETYTYMDLVKRLTDLKSLSILPQEGEFCGQYSSYDRSSRYDPETDKYINWDANGDGNGYLGMEGDRYILAEIEGPGCIWRIWSAKPENGRVIIYLDDMSTPAVDLPFIGYFDLKNEPFTRPGLVHTVASGWNNYTPIPFQRFCKIVAEKGWGQYYHFVYSVFPKNTKVPTFKRNLTKEESDALDRANELLVQPNKIDSKHTKAMIIRDKKEILPGQRLAISKIKGPKAISSIRCRLPLPAFPEDCTLLRQLTIEIYWDSETSPSVWAPLGDFFGTAAGAHPYISLPSGLEPDGWWYSHWYMPFEKQANIFIKNESSKTQTIEFQIIAEPIDIPISSLGRFHAKWHRDAFLPTTKDRAIDWTILKTIGKGRFVGVMLHVWNPKGSWWGEGDEKFFVDYEKFPSTFGTGSEDYFGYAWCNPTLFQHAYHNQTISMNNKGHISVNRWHISDNVPFRKAFDAYIEKYFPNSRPTIYACTVYWYLDKNGVDPYQPLPVGERTGYWYEITNFIVKNAIEGESLKISRITAGNARAQDMTEFDGNWSNNNQLWWTGAKPGDTLDLKLSVPSTDFYTISIALTKARDYGIVQFFIDGQKLTDAIDLYNPEVKPTGPVQIGSQSLSAGEHLLTVKIIGANPNAIPAYMFGLDYLKLKPQMKQ